MLQHCFRNAVLALGALAAVSLAGCSQGASDTDVTLAKAQAAVDDALNGWTRGEPAEKFACSDPDWKGGARLLSFLTADARIVRANPPEVRCQVALTLKDRHGKQRDRTVAYLVQLGDPVTIRRDDKK